MTSSSLEDEGTPEDKGKGAKIQTRDVTAETSGNSLAPKVNALEWLAKLAKLSASGCETTKIIPLTRIYLRELWENIQKLQRERDDAQQQLLAANQQVEELEKSNARLARRQFQN